MRAMKLGTGRGERFWDMTNLLPAAEEFGCPFQLAWIGRECQSKLASDS